MDDGRGKEGVWIFGYGSLIWRPSFPFHTSVAGYVKQYKRRFWQGSTDHRGIPESPGRVVTLIPTTKPTSVTWGMAYFIDAEHVDEVLAYLDYREKGGYSRELIEVYTKDNDQSPHITGALLYRATDTNPEYLGKAPALDIAKQISNSVGPSGKNIEYFLHLLQAMQNMGVDDGHLVKIHQHITGLPPATPNHTSQP
eukprot:TRINITY_DN9766_c0_g1_i1.p1 TRINITY_DN9766_c0_g1~~TRINITY_DN9766_c0_g1_i1.p1  ORF type:complete len:197 (-),score=19.63 TRINITY_DN9766_c0_g1_i1:38-628(-)